MDTPAPTLSTTEELKVACEFWNCTPEELIEDERLWEEAFARTTPEQWDRLEEKFRRDIAEGTFPIEEMFALEDAEEQAAHQDAIAAGNAQWAQWLTPDQEAAWRTL